MVLGAGLFLLFGMVGDSDDAPTDRIVVSAGQVAQLTEAFTRTWQRPPTGEELEGLIEDHIREEVYYREAMAMGLDRDDIIVRRRMRQKLEFVTDDLVATVDPTEEQLETYFGEHADAFRVPSRLSFRQIYFNRDRRGEQAAPEAESLLARLNGANSAVDTAAFGDSLMLPADYDLISEVEVAHRFGSEFATVLAELPVGRWSGPVESGFGIHLVLIRERQPGSLPALAEIRDAVEREWRNVRRQEATEGFYQHLRERYDISIERPEVVDREEGPTVAGTRR
jgi:hypothetical protein